MLFYVPCGQEEPPFSGALPGDYNGNLVWKLPQENLFVTGEVGQANNGPKSLERRDT